VAEIRHLFARYGGNLGAPNSVAWMFDKKGQIAVDATRFGEDATLEAGLEAGADDMTRDGDQYLLTTSPASLHAVLDALKARKVDTASAEVAMVPKNTVRVEGSDAERLLKLMEALEEHDDVSRVYSNFDIDADTLAAVGG
jgi:transcriptional/translational regulatory protein YebC/TACO1